LFFQWPFSLTQSYFNLSPFSALIARLFMIRARRSQTGPSPPLLENVTFALGQKRIEFKSLQESIYTTTPSGRLLFHVFGSIAEFERDLIRERVLAGTNRCPAKRSARRTSSGYGFDESSYRESSYPRQHGFSRRHLQNIGCLESYSLPSPLACFSSGSC
jgi:hypothetical protein